MVETSTARVATGRRAEIQKELLADVEKHLAAKDSYPVVKEDKKSGLKIHQTTQGESAMTVSFIEYEGVTVEAFKWYSQNGLTEIPKANDKVKIAELEEDEGCKVMHQHIKTPIMVTNRSMIQTAYPNVAGPTEGSFVVLVSDKGNEAQIEKYADKIGKDVRGLAHLVYQLIEPTATGIRVTQVIHIDLGGSLPNMI